MDTATIALVLSVVAIVVSGTIGVLGYLLQRRVTAIEVDRRAEEVEAHRRADVIPRFDPPGNLTHLVLSVSGGSRASDVSFELQPSSILLHGEPTSFPSLEPGQEVRVRVAITYDDFLPGVPRVVLVRLRWRDDRGDQAKNMTLTV
jgi:hypothetical protein